MPTKVKFVEYGEQAKVKIVDYGENLEIIPVEYGEQMKVKIVEYGEDLKVKIVQDTGPCLVATACVEAAGLPDDSPVLNVVRSFRDTFVMGLPDGPEMLRRYYELAPQLVSRINEAENRQQIYGFLFDRLVETVNLISVGKHEEALSNTFRAVDELKNLMGEADDVLENILEICDSLNKKRPI